MVMTDDVELLICIIIYITHAACGYCENFCSQMIFLYSHRFLTCSIYVYENYMKHSVNQTLMSDFESQALGYNNKV